MRYKKLAIAGTFDRLHKGHRFFIGEAFRLGEKVVIGLTSDTYAKNKREAGAGSLASRIKVYRERKLELEEFLHEEKLSGRAEIVEINDVYGPSLKQSDIEALVVTEETREGGSKVNKRRKEMGLKELELVRVPLIQAEDDKILSSTRIRLGEIDRWGKVFERLPVFGGKIAEKIRLELKKPLGRLISSDKEDVKEEIRKLIEKEPVCLVAVGDEVTVFLNKSGRQADISIIDFYVKRIRVHEMLEDLDFPKAFFQISSDRKIIRVNNPAGYVNRELVDGVKDALNLYIRDGKKRVIKVDGEEDLAGLPAILLAPLDSLVLYGQPDQGVVAVEVTEEKKREILEKVRIA